MYSGLAQARPELPHHYDCDYNVCRNDLMGTVSPIRNRFTREGVEQIKKAVRERNSVGDMTKLELLIGKA